MSIENLNELSNKVDGYLQNYFAQTKFDNRNLCIVEAIRILDYACILGNSVDVLQAEETDYWYRVFKNHTHGLYTFLRNFYTKQDNTVFFSIQIIDSKTNNSSVLSVLEVLANVALIKRLCDVAKHENAPCEASSNHFIIEFTSEIKLIEMVETRLQEWLKNYLLEINASNLNNQAIYQLLATNQSILSNRFNLLFLDRLYFNKAYVFAETCVGYDYYPETSLFGNFSFRDYRLVVIELIGYATLHKDAYLSHISKRRLEDGIDISPIVSIKALIDYLANRLLFEKTKVEEIISIIIFDDQKNREFDFPSGYASPLLIQIDGTRVIISLMACLTNPFMYLHRCLRIYFSKQYGAAVQGREERFKSDFYSCFDLPIKKIARNLVLGVKGKRTTDIDAILYHEKEQILILVQLKWMEDWATDMRLRRNMKVEFQKKIKKWLSAVNYYLLNEDIMELNQRLGLKKVTKETKVYKLILGKHFTHFEGFAREDDDFYFNWAGLFKLLMDNPQCKKSLKHLVKEMQQIDLTQEAKAIKKNLIDSNVNFTFDEINITIKWTD